jgi:tetratricopeptide (TPR) repeat protein
MNKNEARLQSTITSFVLSFFAVLVYIILIWHLYKPLAGQLMFRGKDETGLAAAIKYNPDNAAYHYLLGKHHHLSITNPDIKKAISHYRESLDLIPLQAAVWTDLAKAYQIDGQASEAEHAFERAVKLDPHNTDLLWEAGTFWLIRNNTGKAMKSLKRYIELLPEKQNFVYDLCFKLSLDNTYLLKDLVPDSYEYRANYLTYLMNTGRVEASEKTWQAIDLNRIDKNLFITYVNFLLDNGLYEKAEKLWEDITEKIEGLIKDSGHSLIWNYSFENDMLEGGFDWTARETEGANVFIDESVHMEGKRSLAIAFDGSTNPDILFARQLVAVIPSAKYTLTANIKTDGITTTNGIFIFVEGHKCKGLNKRTETITGTNFWKEISLDFDVPAQCSALTVNFKRERSNKFDNKVSGTAWIDKIIMKQQSVLTSISAKH